MPISANTFFFVPNKNTYQGLGLEHNFVGDSCQGSSDQHSVSTGKKVAATLRKAVSMIPAGVLWATCPRPGNLSLCPGCTIFFLTRIMCSHFRKSGSEVSPTGPYSQQKTQVISPKGGKWMPGRTKGQGPLSLSTPRHSAAGPEFQFAEGQEPAGPKGLG